ncbi:sensor histidine kinase [Mucilaginibacter sp.]|uniref:sensor histidine kinase n=1 Tax=Mucilaginibacter sp. TaxID=1882438 RepID=UPI0035BC24A7
MIISSRVHLKNIIRHSLFWLAYIAYQALHEGWMDKDELSFHFVPQFLTDVPVAILMAYLNLYLLVQYFYYKRRYVGYVLTLLLLLLAGGIAERFFTYLIWVPWDEIHDAAIYNAENKNFFIPVRIFRNAVEAYPVIAVTMLIKLMRNANQQEKLLREIELQKHSAEMRLLKAQINPHFFFNTLNSLYALTLKGSELASTVVLRLSDLMHYMLYEANDQLVLLANEIKHLESYISIEEMRFADRLDLSFQCSGDIQGKSIVPLLLLPFIENAFKHGLDDNSGWITITLKVNGNQLFMKVENSCPTAYLNKKNGFGLANVKRRLELSYPSRYELQIRQGADSFEVELVIQL